MDIDAVRQAIKIGCVEWSRHGLERMVERTITRSQAKQVILEGVLIEEYVHDSPWPSALFLGWDAERPIHVVAAFNEMESRVSIITVYEPAVEYFEADFKTRKNK